MHPPDYTAWLAVLYNALCTYLLAEGASVVEELPHPRVVSAISHRDMSGYWVNVIYEGNCLTDQQFRRLRSLVRRAVPIAQILKHDLSDGTHVEVELDRIISAEKLVGKYLTLVKLLGPQYRSCIAEARVVEKKNKSMAIFVVIAMFPQEEPSVIGPAIQLVLKPLGDMVGYLPNAQAAADNVYHVAVQPYRVPKEGIEAYLSRELRKVGLDVVGFKQFDVTMADHLAMLMPRQRLN